MFNGYIIEFSQKTHALSNSSKMYILKKIKFLNNLILLKKLIILDLDKQYLKLFENMHTSTTVQNVIEIG